MEGDVKLKEPYQTFDGIANIVSFCCVLGLKFPDSATDFQKASLTLAHLMASIRDYILAGREIPAYILDLIDSLHYIMQINCDAQR